MKKKTMKNKIIAVTIASVITATSAQALASQPDEGSGNKKQFTAISVGAVGGAILAGPAGLVIGGIVGAIAGRDHSEGEAENVDHLAETETLLNDMLDDSKQQDVTSSTMVASTETILPVINANAPEKTDVLKTLVSNDLTMDVYFKAGSVDVENFYAQQLAVMVDLLNELPELNLILDGYSDRQGSEADNMQLSIARLQSVREHFVQRGIDANRINVRAHGEKNFVSQPGELDKYVFDRRVVISFDSAAPTAGHNVAAISDGSSI